MASRLELHEELCDLLGSKNVYFQPPETIKLHYPCIVYQRNTGDTQFANNFPYTFKIQYLVTVITKDPDTDLINRIAMHFPMSRMDRHFTNQNLNHDVFMIYY